MSENERIKEICEELAQLGLMLPGSISKQWYTCGKQGCKCRDSENPKKHGPYNQLSYSISGKHSTLLIKEENLKKAKEYISNYRRFKELNKELLKAHVSFIRAAGFNDKG